MPAVAEDMGAVETVERETPETLCIVTSLYDVIAALNDEVEPWEEDVVTATVVDLCKTRRLQFLNVPEECEVVCA